MFRESGEGSFGCAWLGDTLNLLRALGWRLAAEEVELVGFSSLKDEDFEFGERRQDGYVECRYALARLPLGETAAECRDYEVQKDSTYAGEGKLVRLLKVAGRCALGELEIVFDVGSLRCPSPTQLGQGTHSPCHH